MTADSMNAQASVSREAFNLPALLVIMDGFGLAEAGEGNAISQAKTPCLDRLLAECSHTTLKLQARQSDCLTARWATRRSAI